MKSLHFLSRASRISFSQHAVLRPDIAGVSSTCRISTPRKPYSTDQLEWTSERIRDEWHKQADTAEASATTSATLESIESSEASTDHPLNPLENASKSQLRKDRFRHLNPTSDEEKADIRAHPTTFRRLMRHVTQPVVVVSSLAIPGQGHDPWRASRAREDFLENPFENPYEMEEDGDGSKPVPRAMTVGSFTSLNVRPVPRIMFNVNRPSKTYDAIKTSHRFNVHILADNKEGALLAEHYSKGHSRIDFVPDDNNYPELLSRVTSDFARKAILKDGLGLAVEGSDKLGGLFVHGARRWTREWENWQKKKFESEHTWTPFTREAMPRLESDGILYTLRCVVRRWTKGGSARQFRSGLLELDAATALVIGNVQEVIYGSLKDEDEPEMKPALSYSFQQYIQRGDPVNLSESHKTEKVYGNTLKAEKENKPETKDDIPKMQRPQMYLE
ncbi:hypothetical protein PFICI_11007 [Pestalotiopsis fici W106-1]|uniref:Flavin reductase like domain-containing protein n=1 Tax=Pestalotiopsis fici (strain W106-1 / CGMCC3.15140) TaxID=1229662 RepID=W3WTE3_PESFW|nr:uncharacterized protein PFICI_11007 [Pestalotiopsis fici W106-1]ETS77133.1 hypothetical protein PFICI_11007 [Pestalotiopsis fici W106-1]